MKYELNGKYHCTENIPIQIVVPNGGAQSEFKLTSDAHYEVLDRNNFIFEWAKSGTLALAFERTNGSANLTSVDFLISYGHEVLAFEPSVSFEVGSVSIGISFAWHMQCAAVRSGFVNVPIKKWNDN